MSKLKFGWAEQSITPDKKVSLAGQFAERISEYVEKPICVTALAISSETDQAIFCACDLVDISWGLRDAVRAKLAGNDAGLDPMKVIISATHVHTGPRYAHRDDSSSKFTGNATSFRALIESELPPDKKYIESANISANPDIAQPEETFEFLAEQISKAALAAWTSRTEGSFVNAFGRAPVGMCRRVCYNDGSAQMWGNAETAKFTEIEGGNDSGIELMYVFNEKNELTGIVANLACPAQCVQHRLFVSPDFWGEAKMLLRQHFGEHIFLLPQCSAAGDQCPVDLVRWVEPESDVHDPNLKRTNPHKRKADPSMFDLSGMRKAGKRIANEIIEVYNEGLDAPQTDPEFVHEVHMMQLPLRRTTFAEVAAARRRIHDYLAEKPGDVDFNDAAALQVDLGILRREELQEKMDILDTESHILRLGTVAFATNPFELFSTSATRSRRARMPSRPSSSSSRAALRGICPPRRPKRAATTARSSPPALSAMWAANSSCAKRSRTSIASSRSDLRCGRRISGGRLLFRPFFAPFARFSDVISTLDILNLSKIRGLSRVFDVPSATCSKDAFQSCVKFPPHKFLYSGFPHILYQLFRFCSVR